MTLSEYLEFLDQFWELFGPIDNDPPDVEKFKDMKL